MDCLAIGYTVEQLHILYSYDVGSIYKFMRYKGAPGKAVCDKIIARSYCVLQHVIIGRRVCHLLQRR